MSRMSVLADAMRAASEMPDDSPTMIRVWHFYDAPKEFQELSTNGGDEDWIAHVPAPFVSDYIEWMGRAFGCCTVAEHALADGSVIRIGCHA